MKRVKTFESFQFSILYDSSVGNISFARKFLSFFYTKIEA